MKADTTIARKFKYHDYQPHIPFLISKHLHKASYHYSLMTAEPEFFPYRPNNQIRAPISSPLRQRLQTLAVLFHSTSILLLAATYFTFWCFPLLWPFMIIYTIFYFFLDSSPSNGRVINRVSPWLRNSKFYTYLTDYFPITFHREVELKPTFKNIKRTKKIDSGWLFKTSKNVEVLEEVRVGPKYIFGYHPHGVIATGVSSGFTNNAAGWPTMFPGIKCFVTTLINQFQIPFYRDYLLALGVTSVIKKNLMSVLNQGGSIVIVIGGAYESLLAKPGLNTLVLNKRKGFVKLALESVDEFGIGLVPVYGFGENNVYDVFYTNDEDDGDVSNNNNKDDNEKQKKNENVNENEKLKVDSYTKRMLKHLQMKLKEYFGFTLPIVTSRGIFNYDFGLLPYRRPIDVVVGKPIMITRLEGNKPGDPVMNMEVDYYHQLYIEGLKQLYANNKDKYSTKWDQPLKIVE